MFDTVSAVVCYVVTFLLFAVALVIRKPKEDSWRTFGAKVLAVISGFTHVYAYFSLAIVVGESRLSTFASVSMGFLTFVLGFGGLFAHWMVGIYDMVLSDNLWEELHYLPE